MAPTIALILDLLVAGLLIATIVYAVTLNRRLIELQESRSELEGLIRSFGEATARAEAGIKAMKRTAAETGEGLQKNLERGKALRDELQFMIEAADALAQRLAEAPTVVRGGPQAGPVRRPIADAPRSDPSRSDSSRSDLARPEPSRSDLARSEPPRSEPRRPPAEADSGTDLPRGRGALGRLDSFLSDPPRSEPVRTESSRIEPRLLPEPEGERDLPRGRGALARLESFVSDSTRTEPPPPPESEGEWPAGAFEVRGRGGASRNEAPPSEAVRRPVGRADVTERLLLADESRPARRDGGEGLSRAERELLEAMENRR